MSNTLLSSEDFGLKIYERFPPAYREADEHHNLALKRYLQALSDGGFRYSIEEINGLLDLIDPDRVGADVLPFLYSQYGLELFNGIPENYLRYFLPFLSLAYSNKGSLGVIPFITTSLSGIKTSTDIVLDTYGNPELNVSLEMDYQVVGNNFFPKSEQFKRILENFLPFYVDCTIVYLYNLFEEINLSGIDIDFIDNLLISNEEQNFIGVESLITDNIVENAFNDIVGLFDTKSDNQCCWVLNDTNSLLNTCTLINLDMVDKITENESVKIGIPTYSGYIILTGAIVSIYNLPLEMWENGGIGSHGNLYNSTFRIRLKDYISIPGNNYILTLIVDTEYGNLRYSIQGYRETYRSASSYEGGWIDNGNTFDLTNLPNDTKYIKIGLSLRSGNTISIEQGSIKGANYTITPK